MQEKENESRMGEASAARQSGYEPIVPAQSQHQLHHASMDQSMPLRNRQAAPAEDPLSSSTSNFSDTSSEAPSQQQK